VVSIDNTGGRFALQRYFESIEEGADEQRASIESSAVRAVPEMLEAHPKPESGFMLMRQTSLPA
jgi:hypothetical protein